MSRVSLVIPCYNEAGRLEPARFERFAARHPEVRFYLVDDGSTDGTGRVLEALAGRSERFRVIRLDRNLGKAEAVRRGVLAALEGEPDAVGFWDADLSTPLEAVPALAAVLERRPELEMVFGARVQLLGRNIVRSPLRHYVGRVFATGVSLLLALAVYDTQCGAKLFRATPALAAVFSEPFRSRWIFDVEIIARRQALGRAYGLPDAEAVIYELPLDEWVDRSGSKVGPGGYLRSAADFLRLWRRYRASRWPTPPLPPRPVRAARDALDAS